MSASATESKLQVDNPSKMVKEKKVTLKKIRTYKNTGIIILRDVSEKKRDWNHKTFMSNPNYKFTPRNYSRLV